MDNICFDSALEGQDAKTAGLALEANPYPAGLEHDSWVWGWMSL
jgi:hypothetical protein